MKLRILRIVAIAMVLTAASFAHAALSETTYNLSNQTTALSAHQMFNPASSYDGNYQFSIVINGNADACLNAIGITITWTDFSVNAIGFW